MKKLAAIFLLAVLLFNLAGYSFLFQYLIQKADAQLVGRVDQSAYDDNDLVEVKMPLNLPYITGSGKFERIDGQVEYKGIHYNFVKRKVSRDTLYVLCLPNVSKTALCNAKAAYGKESADLPLDKKGSETVKKINLATEYTCDKSSYKIAALVSTETTTPDRRVICLPHTLRTIPEQPPRTSSC